MLENATRNGATVTSISKNVLSITSSSRASNGNAQAREERKIVESVIDTAQRIVLASTLKTEQGQVISTVVMKYNTNTPNPLFHEFQSRVWCIGIVFHHDG